MKKATDRILPLRKPVPPIKLGARGPEGRSRAETALHLLLRAIAVVWMIEGVQQWLGVLTGPSTVFLPATSASHVAGLFFFCILDFVAAVGLWLTARWGVAVWLATIVGHGLMIALVPGVLNDPVLLLCGDLVLVAAYGALAWTVAREHRLA